MTFKTSFEFEDGPKLRHLQGRKNSGKKHNHPAEVHVQCMKVLSNFLGKQKYISGEQVSRWAIFVFVRSLAEKKTNRQRDANYSYLLKVKRQVRVI